MKFWFNSGLLEVIGLYDSAHSFTRTSMSTFYRSGIETF